MFFLYYFTLAVGSPILRLDKYNISKNLETTIMEMFQTHGKMGTILLFPFQYFQYSYQEGIKHVCFVCFPPF